ncbi:Hypothetical protein GLP15_855 [Giardia lamblia P15]|uniref:Uncharacterized protein n=1 Tax=Giardia intestinalis (strain P15) TaxID=658858 RepID=E1F3U1_GIAIA|nr:Hypothetical protein GLP15_855 [Giardia lamblia P15]
MTIHYAPESMRLSTSVIDVKEYLPPTRIYAPVSRNMGLTTEAQSSHRCTTPRTHPWYIGADGRAIEDGLLCFLKSTVRIKKEANLPVADSTNSPKHQGTFDSIDSIELPYSNSTLNEFHRKITNAKRVDIKASMPRPRICSAHPRSSMIPCTINRPYALSIALGTKLRPTTAISPVEDDISLSDFTVPHNSSNYSNCVTELNAYSVSKQRAETVCSALNLTATSLPRRSNVNLVRSKAAASELLTTILADSLTFSNEARRRRSPKSGMNNQ